jgi:single-strand DNA-binding protein
VAESLTKGMRVIVQGRLRSRSYETREGEKRTVFEVEVEEVGPSLRSVTAKVARVQSPQQGAGWSKDSRADANTGRDPWATASDDTPPF